VGHSYISVGLRNVDKRVRHFHLRLRHCAEPDL